MQACAVHHASFQSIRRHSAQRARRTRTLLVLGILLVALVVLVFAPSIVHTMARTNIPPTIAYTVVPGETLWEIAAGHSAGQDVRKVIAQIKRVNGLTDSTLLPGQILAVPVTPGR